ncbi:MULTISPECIES: hypothetical protein [unclassified Clostridium]|nr:MULTISPECIES: hypothetical protein [unclassified Clostridium]MBX9136785.1 hypothetical protein [Clostridium sp. K12(2020)]MBX9143595.1 hypothetical protein [Clostridium sp. K13]MDU2288906.1 hypothetical protein [Clostridium celatum]MDU4325928.1 hypothetical protein [Clostridium celatum]
MIEVNNLSKAFKVSKRKAGLKAATKSLFRREYEIIHALNNVSFRYL